MGRLHRLTASAIVALTEDGRHADGGGLYLRIRGGAKSWIYVWTMMRGSRRQWREMGLGSYPAVPLRLARERAAEARRKVAEGIDPIGERRISTRSVADAAAAYIADHEAEWSGARTAASWRNSLSESTLGRLVHVPVADVDTVAVLEALKPIWTAKPVAGRSARQRLEAVLDSARVRGWRSGENPARLRGHLDKLLPKRAKAGAVGAEQHHDAIPYGEIPGLWSALSAETSFSSSALRFLILTAARLGEVTGARWREIDLERALWVVPASRMKARREHRVPLSTAAVELLSSLPMGRDDDFVFQGERAGRPLAPATLPRLVKRVLGDDGPTVHGMRSAFRDWCGDRGIAREVAEAALAHTIGNAVEQAYRRGDALDQRRDVMASWSRFVTSPAAANVVPLTTAQRG